jgi:hypothetical protein
MVNVLEEVGGSNETSPSDTPCVQLKRFRVTL